MMSILRAIISCALLAGCATSTLETAPTSILPDGIEGYACYRRANFTGGVVEARAEPDYRGGYTTLSMSWEMFGTGVGTPEIHVHWESGRRWSGSFLTVIEALYPIPPQDTQISLRLSSGEVVAQTFIEPRYWREFSQLVASGYGGHVFTDDVGFMEAFTHAQWADIRIASPEGLVLAHHRLDLTDLREQIETMRGLGAAVEADAADYEHACVPMGPPEYF